MNEENILEGFELVEVSGQVENANNILDGFELVEEPASDIEDLSRFIVQEEEKQPEIVSLNEQPKHVSIDKIQGKFEEDDVLKNLNDFYAEDIKNNLISFDTSGGMRDEITVTTSAGETVIPLNSDWNTTSGFSSLPGREYTKYGEDGSYIDDRESFGKQSYNNLIKTIDSARIKSTPEQKALFKYNDDLGYDAETGTYSDVKVIEQEGITTKQSLINAAVGNFKNYKEEISSPATSEQVDIMRNAAKTIITQKFQNLEKNLNEKQTGFDRSTSTKMPGLALLDPNTDFEYLKDQSYLEYVAASKALKIPYTDEDGFTAMWGTIKNEVIEELNPKKLFEDYKKKTTDIKSLDNTQKEIRNENWKNSLTAKEKEEADFYEEVKKVKKNLKDVNERLKSPSDSTGNESLVNQKLDIETKLKALKETFNEKYKESASRDIDGFWLNNRPAVSDEERKKLNNVYKNSTINAENTLKNSQRSTLTPQQILQDQTNQATLEKLKTLQVGRNQKVRIRFDEGDIESARRFEQSIIPSQFRQSQKPIKALLASGKLTPKDIKSGYVDVSYTDLIEMGLNTEDFEGAIDQLGLSFKVEDGELQDVSLSDGGFMSAKDIKDFKQFERQYYSELMNEQALMDFTYLNKDLAVMETVYDKKHTGIGVLDHLIGGGGTFIQSAAGAIAEIGDGTAQDRQEVEGFLGSLSGTSTRADINAADKIIKDYNNSEYVVKNNMQIKLTDEQKENLNQSLGEAIYSGTGEFVPMIIELAAIDLATGGTLGPAGVAKAFPRMGKIYRHILSAGIEEVKMQTLFDMPPTGGAAFYTFGAITKNMIKLKGPLARWQGVFDKIMVSGVSGMGASEFSKVSEAVYEDLMNEKTFRQSMNEAYGDLDEVQRRMIVSLGNFSMLSIHHLKKADFMSTKAKYDLMDAIEIKANNINDKAAAERGEYTTNDKGERVLNKEFKSIEEKEKYLTESEKSNLNQYSTDFNMLSQYALNESMSNELDPKQVDQAAFEKNFNKRYMDPVNRVLKSFDPEYKAPKILFGNSSKNPSFRENFRSGENSTAEITNDGSRMYFDLKYYTPGKALHEITHLGLQTYYKNNPEAKFRMLEKFDNMFKDVDVDLFMSGEVGELKLTGKQTKKLVEEGYKERSAEERMEEYLAFMVEGLSNPRAYYQNPRIMSGKLAEMRNYFKDVFKEMGANNIEPPQTAYDLIDLLASMGQSARQGTKIQNKFQTFMAALSDENTSFLNSVNIEAFKMAPERTLPENKYREAASKEMASKDLTKEVEGVEKEKVETMVNKVANRAFTKFYKGIPVNVREKAGLDRKTYLESAKTELQEIAREFDPNKKDKDGNPIAFDRFMANRGMQRMNSLATRLGVESAEKPTSKRLGQERAEGEKEFDIKSEDATPEDALIASEESSSTGRKGITVSKKLGSKADKVVAEIKRKIPVEKELQEKFLEDKTYKSLKDLAAKETQEMFGIKPKPGNLTKSDVKNAQIFINNNPDLFYGLLPKQHTTKRVNVGTSKEPKYVTRPDKATGVQNVLLEAFYNKGTRKDNLTPWTKKPARDVKTSEFLELFGITERGNPNLYVKNSNVSSRIKALVEQTGRIITNQTVREVLPEARLVGEGRSKTMASKDLTKTLIKAFKQIKNTGKLNKKELLKGITIEWEIEAIKNLNERRFKVAVDNNVVKLSDLKKLNKLDLEGDIRFFNETALETIALKEGISIPEARERYMGEVVSLIKDGKGLKASISGTTYRSAKERAEPKNFKKSKPYYIDFIERLIPKGSSFSELPASIQKMIMNTIGMGDHRGRTNGRKFTFKEYGVKEGDYIGLLEAVYNIKESSLKGKGPSIESFKEDINIPAPGPSKTKASLAEGAVDFRAEAAKAILGRGQFNVDAVLDANKAALQSVYNSAKEVVKNAKNPKEALDYMIDLMLEQTNRSIGGIKGLAGVESITMEGMRGSNPEITKELHNEHLTELFTMTKDFGKMMERFIKGEQSEASVDLQLKRMVEDYNQGIISEARREIKDFDGTSIRSYVDNLIFLGKDAAKQIPLRESTFAEAENMAEVIRNNATKTILDRIANTPYRKLTLAGVLAKQRQMNKAEYQKLKNQNIEVAKEASMASKDLTQSEMLNELNKRDKAFRLANERNKTIKKIRVFDFDDTLAKSKSLVFYNKPNTSGKPTPNNKAIFMIGGPGSGKSNIGKGLQLGRDGWKVVNQDIFIESEKAKQGLPEIEKDYTKEQKSQRSKIGYAGRKAAEAKLEKYTKDGNGMVIDGTGASYNATMKKVNKLKEQGYEVFMVHAKTSNEVALERNKARKERSLPDFIVEKTQQSVNENIEKYKSDLGDRFMEIDTETIEYGKPLPKDFVSKVKSKVHATERGRLNAEEFAKKGKGLIDEGFVMDFSDFNIVREGERGPMFDIAKKIEAARGTEDVFVLTARAPESQLAIYEFLKSEGLDIPIENITGLGNSTGQAKADWLVGKAAEGYNDFYFADDAPQNVKAVKNALEVLDVKSKTQQAYASKDLSKDFNNLIEESTGIGAEKVFSDVKAQVRGAKAKRQRFFIPPSAEDMLGLVYTTLGKGKKGEAHLKFYQENLFDPYTKAMENLSTDRVNLMSDFKALKKELDVPKDLAKKTESGFTNEQAVRVHLWNKMGEKIPGLSKTDLKELNDIVENNPKLEAFADQILSITKGDGYSKPKENWAVGTITTDLIDVLNTKKRGKYLETWKQNKDLIYSKENLNKLEAAYGPKYKVALENSLRRMESGSNRLGGGNRLSNQVLDYINNSTGAIMFFNTRSAVLQTISAANFINWRFNNPYKAGKAFANQPQYWKDFTELINSDYLKDRRNGLKLNINESEIANAAKTSGNKAKAGLNYILEKGYAPTKFADSFAIASGGATFYRNRINDLIKNEGKTEAEAKEIAMKEFRQVSEISQQSSDPSKISQQQSSDLGRVVLQFANTPMQYARIQKRAVQDIVNGRGDLKANISKIAYYGFLQNMLFNALQQGVFALGFGDGEIDEKEEKKLVNAANGMLDSSLRGLGMAGVTVQVLKNLGINIYDRSKKDRPEYGDSYKKLLDFSPAIKSKLGKFQSAAYPFDSKKRRAEVFEKGFSLDNPAYESMAKVITGTTNLPLDRLYSKVNNLSAAMDKDTETWQSIAMVLGWPEWQIKGRKNYVEAPKVSKEQAKKDLEKKLGVKFL